MQRGFSQQKLFGAVEGLLGLACVILVAVAGAGLFDAGAAVAFA